MSERKPRGRRLEDLWLNGEEGKLHPAEHLLLDAAADGDQCILGENLPKDQTAENTIRANVLRFLALGGDSSNPVHERGVTVTGGWVDCEGGALDLEGGVLPENFFLQSCHIDGGLILSDAITETVSLNGSSLHFLEGGGLESRSLLSMGNGFRCASTVRLVGGQIVGDLDCRGGAFDDAELSLVANRARISGHVYLDDGFAAMGKVSIEDADIGTGVSCRGGLFKAADQGLSLKFSTIDGNVDFGLGKVTDSEEKQPCTFAGGVSLQRARISGDVIFTGTQFDCAGNINLRAAKIDGQLFWRQIQAVEKAVPADAPNAVESGDTDVVNGEPNAVKPAISELNLAGASCLTLNMDWDSWSLPTQIRLDHFTYEGFSELPAEWNADRWKAWLARQPEHHLTSRFRPHPYQQLAKVLEASGFEEEARSIRIARREKQRLFTRDHEPVGDGAFSGLMRRLGNFWRWVQKVFIGHGYRPGLAVIWLLGLVLTGAAIYQVAALRGVMTPTHPLIFKDAIWDGDLSDIPVGRIPLACRENWVYPPEQLAKICASSVASEYSTFSALVYSLDVAIPVVNFRMEDDWSPRVVDWQTGDAGIWYDPRSWQLGWWVRSWEWLQIGAGWALSLLFVSAIGGVIRRE